MKLKGLTALVSLTLVITACTHVDENRAARFQGLSQQQQAKYWQMKKIQDFAADLEHRGVAVYQVGDEYQLIVPAGLIFEGNTPAYNSSAPVLFQAITNLLNAQSMPSIKIAAYANAGSSQRNYALSQSWALTLEDQLRQHGLAVGVVYTAPHGACDNIGKNALSNRLEIHYRVSHDE